MISPKCQICKHPRHKHAPDGRCPRIISGTVTYVAGSRFTPKPPPPRKRIAAVSAKRRDQNARYSAARKLFLAARPWCEAFCAVNASAARRPATEVHHKNGREGDLLLDESAWLATCRDCHTELHQHPATARALGFLV